MSSTQETVSLKEHVAALVSGVERGVLVRLDGMDRATVVWREELGYHLEQLNNAYRIQVQRDSTYIAQAEYRPAHEVLRKQVDALALEAQQRPTLEQVMAQFSLVRAELVAQEARQQEALAVLRREFATEKSRSDTNYGRLGAIAAVGVALAGLLGSLITHLFAH